MEYFLNDCREAWLDAMLALWREHIRDRQPGYEGDVERICDLYRAIGWAWAADDGYDETEDHWCGVGVAAAGLRIGDYLEEDQCVPVSLNPAIAYHVLPSCSRLASHETPGESRWDKAGVPPAEMVGVGDILPGDIVTYYRSRSWSGSHVMMARGSVRDGVLPTVEANAEGRLPTGERGEGVVKNERPVDEIAKVYRFRKEHFVVLDENGDVERTLAEAP